MSAVKTPAKTAKKLTVRSLKIFTGVKAGAGTDLAYSGKKKSVVPSDTGFDAGTLDGP